MKTEICSMDRKISETTGTADCGVKLFFSYAHEDEELRNKLGVHLTPLEQQGVISSWHDRKIGAGMEWDAEIKSQLYAAEIILLLISRKFSITAGSILSGA